MSVHSLNQSALLCIWSHFIGIPVRNRSDQRPATNKRKITEINVNVRELRKETSICLLIHSSAPVHWTNKRWKHIPDVTYQWTIQQQQMPLIWLMRTNQRNKKHTAEKNILKGTKITYIQTPRDGGRESQWVEYVREKSLFVNDKENLEFKFSSIVCLSFRLLLSLTLCSMCLSVCSVRVATHSHNSVRLYEHTHSHIFNGSLCRTTLASTDTCVSLLRFDISHCIRLCLCVFAFVFVRMCVQLGAWLLSDCNSCRWNSVSIKHLHDTLGYYKSLRANHSHFFTLSSHSILLCWNFFKKEYKLFLLLFFLVCTDA